MRETSYMHLLAVLSAASAVLNVGAQARPGRAVVRHEQAGSTPALHLPKRQGYDDDGGSSYDDGGSSDTGYDDGSSSGTGSEPYCDGTESEGDSNCIVSGSPQDCEENDEDCSSTGSSSGSGTGSGDGTSSSGDGSDTSGSGSSDDSGSSSSSGSDSTGEGVSVKEARAQAFAAVGLVAAVVLLI